MKKILSNNRGVALLITILMISIIIVLTLQFNSSMRQELHAAINSKNNIMLGYIAKSGYNMALAILSEDDPKSDSLNDDWAMLKEYSSFSEGLFDSGRFQVEVTDLAGKIQINKLVDQNGAYDDNQKDILIRLLSSDLFGMEEDEAEDLLDNIKDWIDSDNIESGFGGAEDSYYQSLDKPYSCKNGQLSTINEMSQIRGITNKLLFGTSETPALKDYLTVYGNRKGKGEININTADRNIIMALSDVLDETIVDDILAYRENEDNNLADVSWCNKDDLAGKDTIPLSLLTTSSSYFEIHSIGLKDTSVKELKIVVKRNDKKFSTLSWEII